MSIKGIKNELFVKKITDLYVFFEKIKKTKNQKIHKKYFFEFDFFFDFDFLKFSFWGHIAGRRISSQDVPLCCPVRRRPHFLPLQNF